jgi:hypothetical protein
MRRILALAVVSLSLVTWTAAASTASAPSPAALLQTYAPRLVLHPDERFHPERVDGFIADSDLVDGHYDQRLCHAVDGPAALDCYATADQAHAEPAAAYGAYFRAGKRIVLEYWLFYAFDLYGTTDPPGEIWQDHEGDWEAVAVVLDAAVKPLLVGTSRHCSGARRTWSRVERRGTHPVVYVALGSHANYFQPGEVPIALRCLPPAARAAVQSNGIVLRDHVAAGTEVAPQIVRLSGTSPSWVSFPGAWGEAQYVHFPNNAALAYGFAPVGPAFQALWRRPLAEVLAWPAG